MRLHAVRAADDQNGAVHHLQGTLHLRGKVHVSRRVQQRDMGIRQGQQRLLGEDGDAALPLLHIVVEIRIAVVNAPHGAQRAALIEQRLAQRGLSGIHVGQQANGNVIFPALAHCGHLLFHHISIIAQNGAAVDTKELPSRRWLGSFLVCLIYTFCSQ